MKTPYFANVNALASGLTTGGMGPEEQSKVPDGFERGPNRHQRRAMAAQEKRLKRAIGKLAVKLEEGAKK